VIGKDDLKTLANGLFPVGGPEASALPPEGRDEICAAVEVILKLHDYQKTKLSLALGQLDKAAAEIERLKTALQNIASGCANPMFVARAALEPKPRIGNIVTEDYRG
jgi:hypothetical protein